mmetsp:Transcript_12818/g.32764  ORF Transcript_12818/g.32764 Transcript_12818/m.32764 type:complete len:166 (+) Transcript_12818:349-846(+)
MMEAYLDSTIPASYRAKLSELFEELDTDRDGHLTRHNVQLLGYAVTGEMPTYDDVEYEMARARHYRTALARREGFVEAANQDKEPEQLSWEDFLVFSENLCRIPSNKFKAFIDNLIVRLRRADSRVSVENLQRAQMVQMNKYKFTAKPAAAAIDNKYVSESGFNA